jgi:hypothetical protein
VGALIGAAPNLERLRLPDEFVAKHRVRDADDRFGSGQP